MQISDKLGQYNRNVNSGTEELRGAQSVQKLVSTVGELSKGSVFEGTVNSVRGGKVTLALGNGQMILARMDGKVDIKPGMAMFFQVRSNDGSTISIRPYNGIGNVSNPILLNALTSAQVPVTERTLTMVDAMMQEQMPVDRQSILDMVKVLTANPESNVRTIVQMMKLGIPVTEAMAAQFENYLSDHHEILNKMELAAGQLAEVLGDEQMTPEQSFALYGKLVDIFSADGEKILFPNTNAADLHLEGTQAARLAAIFGDETAKAGAVLENHMQGQTLGSLLSPEQLEHLFRALQEVPTLVGYSSLFGGSAAGEVFVDTMHDDAAVVAGKAETSEHTKVQEEADLPTEAAEETKEGGKASGARALLDKDMPVADFMRTLRNALEEHAEYGFSGMKKLFSRKEFQTLLRGMAEEQWLVKPKDIKKEDILKLYEKLERQIDQLESAVKSAGTVQNSFLQTAADIRGNMDFMNQMNQIYHYVQLPLKMSGQNANGELYVYTNKKVLNDPEAELTAFLHLDMENLGATDVSVRMKDRQVKTNFYLEDDASYDLVEKHLPILEKHLQKKGYTCSITVTNEKRDVNFKENFVKHGQSSVGTVHRYSFDVRA